MPAVKSKPRYWLTIPLPSRAAKRRYEQAASLTDTPKLATWARLRLDRIAAEELQRAAGAVPEKPEKARVA